MTAGVFTVQEIPAGGGTGERFEWTSDRRSIPKKAWEIGGRLRTVRTDYPGAENPSEQVLGPSFEPFTLEGRWDDRYNTPGFAVAEMRRFEAMCRRGNPVWIQFQGQVFFGLVTEWVFPYSMDWRIGYRFTVSNHGRPDAISGSRSPSTVPSTSQSFDEVDLETQALLAVQKASPAHAFKTPLKTDVDELLATMSQTRDALADTLDTRTGALKPIGDFKRMATQFRIMGGQAMSVTEALVAARSDTELGIRTALTVLDFESWSRTLRSRCRLLMGSANRAARHVEERDTPAAKGFYKPHRGESLYHVSRQVYGTPYAWRLIADANNLSTFQLDGTETLLIPERGEG